MPAFAGSRLVNCMAIVRGVFVLVGAALAISLPGCDRSGELSPPAAPPTAAASSLIDLQATLVDPLNVELSWKSRAIRPAGYLVQYSPNDDGQFVIIETVGPEVLHYRHANLMAETKFVYRVVPYFGMASNVAEITTGKESAATQSTRETAAQLEGSGSNQPTESLRADGSASAAAPTDLRAMLIPPDSVHLQWTNHAQDADAYFVEIKRADADVFSVSIYLDGKATSVTSNGLPFDTHFSYRMRAIYYGQASNVVVETTGAETQPAK
jgi:hypothetical protein